MNVESFRLTLSIYRMLEGVFDIKKQNWIIKHRTQVLIVVKKIFEVTLQFPLFQDQIIFMEKIFLNKKKYFHI